MRRRADSGQSGFTLLEVMVAFTLIVVVVFATVMSQSQGVVNAARDRNIVIATNLAENLINEQELKVEGKSFDSLEEKQSGQFDSNKDFKWTIEYAKVDFSALTDLIARQNAKQGGDGADDQQQTALVMRVFKDYLEKSVRRMKVTIEWPDGKGTSTQTFSQLLVNYDTELNLSI